MLLDQRRQPGAQVHPASDPLEVRPAAVVIWAVQGTPRKGAIDPPERFLMADVHAERDLRLTTVPAKVALTDEEPHEKPGCDGLDWHTNS